MTAPVVVTEHIPAILKQRPHWVCWRYEERDGKRTKVPYHPSGRRASSTNSSTWSMFDAAASAGPRFDGIGFVLAPDDGLVGVDLDHCIDESGEIAGWAADIIGALDSYTEITPSGAGLRVFCSGGLPPGGRKRGAVELYDRARFLTVTGRHVPGTRETIEARSEQISTVHSVYFPPDVEAPPSGNDPHARQHVELDDRELLDRAETAANGSRFAALWRGDTTEQGGDDSAADLALASHLAFWTGGDVGRMDRLFRQSGLMRPKWDDRRGPSTYGQLTLAKAAATTHVWYSPAPRLQQRTTGEINSSATRVVANEQKLTFRTAQQIAGATPATIDWVCRPWVARGSLAEVDAKMKAGKTTWVTHLCRAVLDGQNFMGEPTCRSPVVYLTEQPDRSFREALRRADLLERADFHVLFWHETVGLDWPGVAARAIAFASEIGAGMLLVDTLPQFAGLKGESENNSGDALAAIQPLQEGAATHNLGVLVVRHERKSGGEVGDSARGSSAFGGAVDVVIQIRRPEGNARSTMRVISALSRFDETPDTLIVELTPDGYVALGSEGSVAAREARAAILRACPESPEMALPTADLMTAANNPKRTIAYAVLEELVRDGSVERTGKGRKGDPHRYWRRGEAEIHSSVYRNEVPDERIYPLEQRSERPLDVGGSDTRSNGQIHSSATSTNIRTNEMNADASSCVTVLDSSAARALAS